MQPCFFFRRMLFMAESPIKFWCKQHKIKLLNPRNDGKETLEIHGEGGLLMYTTAIYFLQLMKHWYNT